VKKVGEKGEDPDKGDKKRWLKRRGGGGGVKRRNLGPRLRIKLKGGVGRKCDDSNGKTRINAR